MVKVSIVTVVFNDQENILKTIKSVTNQNFKDREYLVIDGGSTDNTKEIINQNISSIDKYISEKDKGIYDAMNKAIDMAEGEWIIFMNSGDVFVNDHVLEKVFSYPIGEKISFIYSDYYVGKTLVPASFDEGMLLHQAIIYKKEMHNTYGYYQVTKPYIISDFMFFMRFKPEEVMKINVPIAKNEQAGVSSGSWCLYQRLCCDYIYHKISLKILVIKILYWSLKFLFKK